MPLDQQIGHPIDEVRLARLRRAMEFSLTKLKPFRFHRKERLKQFVGSNYSDDGHEEKQPLNMMQLGVNVYTRKLAPSVPAVSIYTSHQQLKPRAADLELAMNHLLQEINLAKTFREAVQEALLGMGIVKVGVTVQQLGEIEDFLKDPGQVFAESVPLDDWVHDMVANKLTRASFMGDRYRMPYEELLASGMFDNSILEKIGPSSGIPQGVMDASERGETLSKGETANPDEFEDYIDLWDIWLPRQNLVITLPVDADGPILRTVEWEGPECGPYSVLSFEDVPSNVMPLPPAAHWQDLAALGNRLFTKLGRQAERQKTILGVPDNAVADGQHILEANDGDALRMSAPGACQEFRTGGVDQANLAFLLATKELTSYRAGNLDALAGLGAQADTFGQEQIIADSSSELLSDMKEQANAFFTSVCRSIGWHLWYDPLIQLPLVRRNEASGVEIPFEWGPDSKEGDYLDYNVSISAYGMKQQAPGEKLQSLTQIMGTVLGPLMPLMEMQGVTINIESLVKLIAKNANLPELNDIIMYMSGETSPGRGPVEAGRMPAQTTRTNIRVNRPGQTREGFAQSMMATLMGSGMQPAQQRATGRPVS